jgi:hypothetical protein
MTGADATAPDTDDLCECGLAFEPPLGAKWWRPDLDIDPGRPVQAVSRAGEGPELRRAIRRRCCPSRTDGSGWCEHGAMVNFHHDITPPMPWARVGTCWAEKPHPVVAVRQDSDGRWVVDA